MAAIRFHVSRFGYFLFGSCCEMVAHSLSKPITLGSPSPKHLWKSETVPAKAIFWVCMLAAWPRAIIRHRISIRLYTKISISSNPHRHHSSPSVTEYFLGLPKLLLRLLLRLLSRPLFVSLDACTSPRRLRQISFGHARPNCHDSSCGTATNCGVRQQNY